MTEQRIWADFTKEEHRLTWSLEFIELAEKEIEGYDGIEDSYSNYPWCAPWLVDEGKPITPPRIYLDMVKSQIQNEINKNSTTNKKQLLTDEEIVNAVYQWNMYFFDGRMKATKEAKDVEKYNYLVKNEVIIKDTAFSYLNYWKKVNPKANPFDYVLDCTRELMEKLEPPKQSTTGYKPIRTKHN